MMTTDQSLERLFSKRGWYRDAGIPAGTARASKKRFLEGRLEFETRIKILQACGFRIAREMQWEEKQGPERDRLNLVKKLRRLNVFWSYDLPSNLDIPDDVLIEKVLLYLDMDEIKTLCKLFERKKIKKVWVERILCQEPMYHAQNRLYAFLLFGIRDPDRYIRDQVNKRLKQFQ
jgi:hypothetical protein